jgi:hypothetical protein
MLLSPRSPHFFRKPYLHYFETKFLQHLEKTSTEELRAKTSQMGVLTDF